MKIVIPKLNFTFNKVLSGIAFLGFCSAIGLVIINRKPPLVTQPISLPTGSPYKHFIAGAGIIEAESENINLSSLQSGIIDQIYIKVTDKVMAGTPLFKLDSRQADAALLIKEASFKTAQANLLKAQAIVKDSEDKLNLARSLNDKRAISKEEFLTRQNTVLINKASFDSARAELITAEAELHSARIDLEILTVKAPMSCSILQVNIRPGEFVAGANQSPLILLGTTNNMHVRVDIDENDAWRFQPNTKAIGYLRGNNKFKIDLFYVRTEPYILPKKSLTGEATERVDTRVLQVIYKFDPRYLPLYIGQQLDVYIETFPNSKIPNFQQQNARLTS